MIESPEVDPVIPAQQIEQALKSNDPFPIDFDDAWCWIGWSKKQTAKLTLKNNFQEGLDFLPRGIKSPSGGRPSELIMIGIDCFKSLAMMAGTERGKQVRCYFLECEKRLREVEQKSSPKDPIVAQLESLIEVRQKQLDQERMLQEQQQRIDRQQEQIQEFKDLQVAAQLELKALPPSSHDIPPERLVQRQH